MQGLTRGGTLCFMEGTDLGEAVGRKLRLFSTALLDLYSGALLNARKKEKKAKITLELLHCLKSRKKSHRNRCV